MASTLQPWEQQPGESSEAFTAFVAYRDLGATRAIDEAFRAARGAHGGSKRAPGNWMRWCSKHQWVERAKSYDIHLAAERQRGIDRQTQRQAEEWTAIRAQFFREEQARWRQYHRQADLLANMPVVTRTVSDDGRTTVYEAVDPEILRKAARIAYWASERMLETIDRAIGVDERAAQSGQAAAAAVPAPDDVRDEARREIERFRAEQRRNMLTMPSGPPGEAPEETSDGQ